MFLAIIITISICVYWYIGTKLTGFTVHDLWMDETEDAARIVCTAAWPLYIFWFYVLKAYYIPERVYLYVKHRKMNP